METADSQGTDVRSYVAANVVRLRRVGGLTVRELSRRLETLGDKLLPSAVTKIEQGQRGVDVQDLVSLSLALGVHPPALLLPPLGGGPPVHLTSAVSYPIQEVCPWMHGSLPLPQTAFASLTTDEVDEFLRRALPGRLYRAMHGSMNSALRDLVFLLQSIPSSKGERRAEYVTRARHDLDAVRFELDRLEREGQ